MFYAMSHEVNKKAPLIVFPPPVQLTRFSPVFFVVLQAILYQAFAMIRLLQKIIHKIIYKIKFFISTYCWFFLILLFCVYVFLRTLFQNSVIIKLRITVIFALCIAFY